MIVVNSHRNYGIARFMLLNSMRECGFPMNKVIVVIAGSDRDCIEDFGMDNEVYIHVQNNCYDLTHAFGVFKHIDHPRVKAEYYVCIHDCCTVLPDFEARASAFLTKMKTEDLDVLYAVKDRKLGLVGLSHSFMKHHGHNYYRNINKSVAWEAEHGRGIAYSAFVPPEKVSQCDCGYSYSPAIQIYGSDIYRHPILIESLGIVKYVANDGKINPVWQKRVYP